MPTGQGTGGELFSIDEALLLGEGGWGGDGEFFSKYDCATTQVRCSAQAFCSGSSLIVDADCECDTGKPREPDDCSSDEQLVCRTLLSGSYFDCVCSPQSELGCASHPRWPHPSDSPNYHPVHFVEEWDCQDVEMCGCRIEYETK